MNAATASPPILTDALLALQAQPSTCDQTNFQANVDFYGFGIRLGVYLQWLSSWISNTLDPENCSENHEENSIFVLAIAIALAVAFRTDDLKVAEVYILLLICTGFFCIVLSTWGIRLHLLRPGAVHVSPLFWHGNRVQRRRQGSASTMASSSWLPRGAATAVNGLMDAYLSPRHMPLSQGGSGVKPTGLSWAGAVWRSMIATLVIVLNLYLWLSYDPATVERPGCEPLLYFFGPQRLKEGLQVFFIVVCFLAGTFVLQLILALASVLYFILLRLVLGPFLDLLRLTRVKNALLDLLAVRLQLANHQGIIPAEQTTVEHIKAAVFALSSQKESPVAARPHVHPHHQAHGQGYRLSMAVVVCWHVWLLTLMGVFITFIEQTIQINEIQGAFVIRSTSQLIPFVIGLISMLNTVRQLLLQWYEEDHPNEEDTHFLLTGSLAQMTVLGLAVEAEVWVGGKIRGGSGRGGEEGVVDVEADSDSRAVGPGGGELGGGVPNDDVEGSIPRAQRAVDVGVDVNEDSKG